MERNTIIATAASGALVLVAGVGAVAAVGSLKDAGEEAAAIGTVQSQLPLTVASDVALPPTAAAAKLKVPKLKNPPAQGGSQGEAASSNSSGSASTGTSSSSGSSQSNKSSASTGGGSKSSGSAKNSGSNAGPVSSSKPTYSDDSDDHEDEKYQEDEKDEDDD
ncbi:MAG: hypothetical protein HQ526_03020 [Actinobacteria bacterium]|nr:hypothetical protein [Actinomycetota bacterium]